jgi:hypothetical protein
MSYDEPNRHKPNVLSQTVKSVSHRLEDLKSRSIRVLEP